MGISVEDVMVTSFCQGKIHQINDKSLFCLFFQAEIALIFRSFFSFFAFYVVCVVYELS